MASLFTKSDAEVRAKIDDLLSKLADAVHTGPLTEDGKGVLALITIYQNELNRRLLEKILKTQTDDE